MGAVILNRAGGTFKPARSMLIHGKKNYFLRMCIVKKLDMEVNLGRNQFKVGESEWGMMTFNAKRLLVFALGPSSCSYNKLSDYFGKLRGAKIEVLQAKGDFGGDLSFREDLRSGKQRTQSRMGVSQL